MRALLLAVSLFLFASQPVEPIKADDGGVCQDYRPVCPGSKQPVCICFPDEYGGTNCTWACL